MTIYDLHLELEKRVKALTEAAGIHDLKVYIRNLPPLKYEGDADKLFPHCLISVGDGSDDGEKSKITVFLGLGTKDTAPELTGYQDICHLIDVMRLSFAENPNHRQICRDYRSNRIHAHRAGGKHLPLLFWCSLVRCADSVPAEGI